MDLINDSVFPVPKEYEDINIDWEQHFNILGEYTDLFDYDSNLSDYLDHLANVADVEQINLTLRQTLRILDLYVLPVVVVIGLVGNSLSYAVLMGSYLRRYSSNVYLAALAWTDNIFLLCVLLSWVSQLGVNIYNREGWCQTLVYLTYVTSFLSVWYVVAFSIERYIAVIFPLKRQEMCTTWRAKLVVVGCAVVASILYVFSPITLGITEYEGKPICAPLPQYNKQVSTFNNIDTLITFIIPVILIIGCNVRIAYTVLCFYRKRLVIVSSPGVVHRTTHFHRYHQTWNNKGPMRTNVQRNHSAQSQIKVTKMLLLVSSVFLILNLPSHAVRSHIIVSTLIDSSYAPSKNYVYWHKLFQFIYYMNFSVNFFLYNLSGRTFRRGLKRLLRGLHKQLKSVAHNLGSTKEETPSTRVGQRVKTIRSEIALEHRLTADNLVKFHVRGSSESSFTRRLL